jgi:hypothetical protein
MNLENLNLVELNAQEAKTVEGGFLFRISFFGFNIYSWETGVGSTTDFW